LHQDEKKSSTKLTNNCAIGAYWTILKKYTYTNGKIMSVGKFFKVKQSNIMAKADEERWKQKKQKFVSVNFSHAVVIFRIKLDIKGD